MRKNDIHQKLSALGDNMGLIRYNKKVKKAYHYFLTDIEIFDEKY